MYPRGHENDVLALELERPAPRRGGVLRKQVGVYLRLALILGVGGGRNTAVSPSQQSRLCTLPKLGAEHGGGGKGLS